MRHVLTLLPICLQTRISDGVQRMRQLPHGRISTPTLQRVRRLLLVMSLRGNAYEAYGYRVGDLTWLQTMTSLKEIRVVFILQDSFKFNSEHMAPIRAIAESVPRGTRILFGPQSRPEEDDVENSDETVAELSVPTLAITMTTNCVASRKSMYVKFEQHLNGITERRGVLSASATDHSRCSFENCVDGAGCVNSTMRTSPLKKQGRVSKILRALAPRAESSSSRRLRM